MASIGGKRIFAGLEFDFGLEPVIKFLAGCAAASFKDFPGTSPDLFRCGRWRFGLRCGLFRFLVRLHFRVFVSMFHFLICRFGLLSLAWKISGIYLPWHLAQMT
jgi:hypothetical protein